MLENVAIEDVLFLDIETVPATASLDEISEDMQELWNKKSSNFRSADESSAAKCQLPSTLLLSSINGPINAIF